MLMMKLYELCLFLTSRLKELLFFGCTYGVILFSVIASISSIVDVVEGSYCILTQSKHIESCTVPPAFAGIIVPYIYYISVVMSRAAYMFLLYYHRKKCGFKGFRLFFSRLWTQRDETATESLIWISTFFLIGYTIIDWAVFGTYWIIGCLVAIDFLTTTFTACSLCFLNLKLTDANEEQTDVSIHQFTHEDEDDHDESDYHQFTNDVSDTETGQSADETHPITAARVEDSESTEELKKYQMYILWKYGLWFLLASLLIENACLWAYDVEVLAVAIVLPDLKVSSGLKTAWFLYQALAVQYRSTLAIRCWYKLTRPDRNPIMIVYSAHFNSMFQTLR